MKHRFWHIRRAGVAVGPQPHRKSMGLAQRGGNTMNKLISTFCFTGVMITMLASVTAQSGGTFVIQKSVIAGGG